jgi:hypothetical protein
MADKLMQHLPPNPANARAMHQLASLPVKKQELLLGFMGQTSLSFRHVHIAEVVELFTGDTSELSDADRQAEHTEIIRHIVKEPEFGRTAHPTSAVQRNTKPRTGGLKLGTYTILCLDGFEAHLVHPVTYKYRNSWVVSVREFFA